MKSYSSREVIKILKANGWYLTATVGSHHHFKHPNIPGKVTVKHPNIPGKETVKHPAKDIPRKTLASIAQQSGLRFP